MFLMFLLTHAFHHDLHNSSLLPIIWQSFHEV